MDTEFIIFILVSAFSIIISVRFLLKQYKLSVVVFCSLIVLIIMVSIVLKNYAISNAIFFILYTIVLVGVIKGGFIEIKKPQKNNMFIIGLFIAVPIMLIGYWGTVITPLFLPANISIENPLKINSDNTVSLGFVFTPNKYNFVELLLNNDISFSSLNIDNNNFFVYSEPLGLKPDFSSLRIVTLDKITSDGKHIKQSGPDFGSSNVFTPDKRYIKRSIFILSNELANSASFTIKVDYMQGDVPILILRKASFECSRVILKAEFNCVKK